MQVFAAIKPTIATIETIRVIWFCFIFILLPVVVAAAAASMFLVSQLQTLFSTIYLKPNLQDTTKSDELLYSRLSAAIHINLYPESKSNANKTCCVARVLKQVNSSCKCSGSSSRFSEKYNHSSNNIWAWRQHNRKRRQSYDDHCVSSPPPSRKEVKLLEGPWLRHSRIIQLIDQVIIIIIIISIINSIVIMSERLSVILRNTSDNVSC